MHELIKMITSHTVRGECQCGRCLDKGTAPDPFGPHTVDMIFFKVGWSPETPDGRGLTAEMFKKATIDYHNHHGNLVVNPFDGGEHNYLEIGAWIGDQGLGLQFMALGVLLGVFELLTPITVLGVTGEVAMMLAGSGLVMIQSK